jgi:hypothetical protein
MAVKGKNDQFANYAVISNTESAANTLTFKKLETGISLSEKVAWVVNRAEYFLSEAAIPTLFNGTNDTLNFGLSVSSSFTVITPAEATIIDFNTITRLDFGAAASGWMIQRPWVKDFSNLPGGGILVPPVPLYAYSMGTGLASASVMVTRLYYTLLQLSVDQYWELVETRRVLSS